jgi:taurine dioxygenase
MSNLEVRPLQDGISFGVRVRGMTLDKAADASVKGEINALFEKEGLIVFEDVEPSGRMHVALSNMFGPLKDHPSSAVPRVDQDQMPGVIDMVSEPHEPGVVKVGGRELAQWLPWHFDHAYNNELNRAGVLRAIDIPPEDGRTGFLDGIELYDKLSPDLRERIEGNNVLYRMDVIMENLRYGRPQGYEVVSERPTSQAVNDASAHLPRAVHPAVWTRPSGEKVLHVSPWMAKGIEGCETPEGDALLDAVCREIFALGERFSYFHSWKTTDMLIWDNWRVLHSVSGNSTQYRRRMQRTTIKGDYGLGYFEGGRTGDKILEMTY